MNEPKTMSYDTLLRLVKATEDYKAGQLTSRELDLYQRCVKISEELGTQAFGSDNSMRGDNVFDIIYALIGAFRLMPDDVTPEYVAKAVALLLGTCGINVEVEE